MSFMSSLSQEKSVIQNHLAPYFQIFNTFTKWVISVLCLDDTISISLLQQEFFLQFVMRYFCDVCAMRSLRYTDEQLGSVITGATVGQKAGGGSVNDNFMFLSK